MIALALPGGGYGVLVSGADAIDVVPGRPVPEQPAAPVQVLDTGDAVWCTLGVRWPVDEEWLRSHPPDALRAAGFTGAASMIRVAVAGTPRVTLTLTTGPGAQAVEAASAPSAGYPPYTTLLRASLGAAEASAVRAALDGREGRAFVSVHAELPADLPLDAGVLARTALRRGTAPRSVTASADLAHWTHRPA